LVPVLVPVLVLVLVPVPVPRLRGKVVESVEGSYQGPCSLEW
jgi:hypothetical protein